MNVLSLFDGMSCGILALERAKISVDTYYSSEIDKYAEIVSKANYPNIIRLGDVTKIKTNELNKIDLLIGGSPCFTSDTQILTINGYKAINEVVVGDMVLSHTGNWRKVLKIGNNKNTKTRIIKGYGNIGIETTDEHPFYTRNSYREWNNSLRTSSRKFTNPNWIEAKNLKNNSFNSIRQINTEGTNNNYNFWYMIGRYTGDGWYRKTKRKYRHNSYIYQFIICCGKKEFNELKNHFNNFGFKYNFSEERTGFKFRICSMKLVNFVTSIGKGASNKVIHPNLFRESLQNKKAFLDGLFDSDGYYMNKFNKFKLTTTSHKLALGVQQLITDVYSQPASLELNKRPNKTIIEGRLVNQKDTYVVSFKKDTRKQDKAFFENGYSWIPVKSNEETKEFKTVYNLEVEIDNSYTANNIVVHNCQGFSFAGKQLNFDDPRSKLFFEFVRILNELKVINPNIKFLLENVKMKKEYQDIISEHLGIQPIEINSNLVSAQNRKRLYWTNISDIKQPENKNILLKDILELGVIDRDESFCLDANYWKGTTLEQYLLKNRRQIVFTEKRTEEAKLIRKEYMKLGRDFSPRRGKELVAREDGKCNCLTTSLTKEHILLDESNNFRKLTPIECERLQTVPDNYTNFVSNTQRYKMLGNGWTIDIIAHIFKNLNNQL